ALDTSRFRRHMGRLGGTPFELGDLKNLLEDEVMLPVSELNRMRRELAAQLEHLRAQPKRWTMNAAISDCAPVRSECRAKNQATPELIVLVRNLAQLEAALNCGIPTVYCEFEDPKKYRDA